MKRWIITLCFALLVPVCSLAEVWTEDQFTSDGQFSMRYYLFQDEWPVQLVNPMQEYAETDHATRIGFYMLSKTSPARRLPPV